MAAVVVCSQNIETVQIGRLTNGELIVCSMYCKFRVALEQYMAYMEELVIVAVGGPLLIGMDANSSSRMWHSKVRQNARGLPNYGNRAQPLEELLVRLDLCVLNEHSPWYTFCGPRGQSDIDVTVGNKVLTTKFATTWLVLPEANVSDHNTLLLTMTTDEPIDVVDAPPMKWSTKRADWHLFREVVAEAAAGYRSDGVTAEQMQCEYDRIVNHTCQMCLTKETIAQTRPQRWWTAELSRMRNELRRARTGYQLARKRSTIGPTITEEVRQARRAYFVMERVYGRRIQAAKAEDWRQFVQQSKRSEPMRPNLSDLSR